VEISTRNLEEHLRALTRRIGVRLAGSAAERRAADYLAERFERAGARVSVEEFPMRERAVTAQELRVKLRGKWVSFPCSLFSSTPGTGGRTLEAPIVFAEAPAGLSDRDLRGFRGRAVVHLGCHIESREAYRRLVRAKPAFLLFVDVRYPGASPLADGMFPSYARDLGAVPTVNVAFLDAWRWKVEGASAARLRVAGGMRPSVSQNVVADLPGDGSSEEVLFMGAHHDTQADSVGADDNGTGVAALLEAARLLAPERRRRRIRLVSFGCEEQLSVGSAAYARAHRGELRRTGALMLNLDGLGSHLGWNVLICNGPPELEAWLPAFFRRAGEAVELKTGTLPYADHFPFAAAGVPSATLSRQNCATGRFFHHRPDDDLSRVSLSRVARLAATSAACLRQLASARSLPFPRRIPASLKGGIRRCWEDLFGGWGRAGVRCT
jgi:hypothetical protein